MTDRTISRWTTAAAALAAAACLCLAGPAAAQDGGTDQVSVDLGGLLRTGFTAGPGDLGARDGFEIWDARLGIAGEVGIVFDYFVQAEWDDAREEFRLLDARLTFPIVSQLSLDLGQFKAPFGKETLMSKGDITFVERAQISRLVPPGRQVGARLSGEAMEGKLGYRAGVFNGNGRTFTNDNDALLWAGRVQFNTVGGAEFHDELVVEVGANAAFSEDSAVNLVAGLERPVATRFAGGSFDLASFSGDRTLYGGDLRLGWQGVFLRGEYLRGEFDPPGLVRSGDVVFGDELVVEGAYLEGGYSYLGAIEAVVRWDTMNDAIRTVGGQPVNAGDPTAGSDFLVFGLNLFPGYHAKVGLQYSVGLNGTRVGPGLADGEFSLMAQVGF